MTSGAATLTQVREALQCLKRAEPVPFPIGPLLIDLEGCRLLTADEAEKMRLALDENWWDWRDSEALALLWGPK